MPRAGLARVVLVLRIRRSQVRILPGAPAPLDPGWLANGGNPSTFNLLNMVQAPSAKLALAAMVFDGVF